MRKQIAMAGLPVGYKIPGAKNRWWEPEEIRAWWDTIKVPAPGGTYATSVHPNTSRTLGLPTRA